MDKNLQNNLSQLLTFLNKGMTTAYEVGKQEIPEFIKEYLMYEFYHDLFWGIILISTVILACIVMYNFRKKLDEFIMGLFGFIIMALLMNSICFIEEAVKIKVAPRVFLMEKARQLVK